ncbi:MAG: hypothetical protein QGF59_17105 [Pirellulaceae bacterium]|jgi:flagellar basal body-associated protein FliL|nr:hypothetical protein [Pirellulaceae bacterium]
MQTPRFAGQAKATAYGRGRLLVVIIVIIIVIVIIIFFVIIVFDAVTESLDHRFETFEAFGDVPQVLT